MQRLFLEQFLRGVDTGVTRDPPIRLAIRRDHDNYRWRYEDEWPIARTQWTPAYLDAADASLSRLQPSAAQSQSYSAEPSATPAGVRFATRPLDEECEVTGLIKLKLWVSSSTDRPPTRP